MAIKVVQGLVNKPAPEARPAQEQQVTKAPQPQTAPTIPASVQQAVSKAVQNNEAVVSTLRSVNSRAGGGLEKLKDAAAAEKTAKEVSEKVKGDAESALGAHSELSAVKSGGALLG